LRYFIVEASIFVRVTEPPVEVALTPVSAAPVPPVASAKSSTKTFDFTAVSDMKSLPRFYPGEAIEKAYPLFNYI
jgi:hypothetical protein